MSVNSYDLRTLRALRRELNKHVHFTLERGEDSVPLVRLAHHIDALIGIAERNRRSQQALAKLAKKRDAT